MSAFLQSEIDASTPGVALRNNPGGGGGADYTAICAILEDKNNIGYSLLWQSGDDETAEGFEKHQIGVTCAPDERFAYIVCTEKTDYSLAPDTFSEVSDEIIIHRVFCAALRPTNTNFTFSNPIKDITVSASADTVNLQVIAKGNKRHLPRRPLSDRRLYSIRFHFPPLMKLIMSSEHSMRVGVFVQ